MWRRFSDFLRCPLCIGGLTLRDLTKTTVPVSAESIRFAEDRGLAGADFNLYIEAGLLCCDTCRSAFPILHGLPILLPYQTPAHEEFKSRFGSSLDRYKFPSAQPAPGEELVLRSFSREWLTYDYDGVIWELNYDDHERRFLAEMGRERRTTVDPSVRTFLEVGCGIGITTFLAQKNFAVDAVGLDLSDAALRAATHYKNNPFLHFVQASAFAPPFADDFFDLMYSRGVLHHTFSTHEAFRRSARLCRPGGLLYLWVYGPGSITATPLRRALYASEVVFRRLLSHQSARVATIALSPIALVYMGFNAFRHAQAPEIQRLSYARALHAARDRYTPRYAHRHSESEVTEWFAEAGFHAIEIVDWRTMPRADHDDYRRNVGVRAIRNTLISNGL
jgi:SAM-dependent methyltransferase